MIWTLGEKLFCQIVGFAQGVALARLLTPGDFGLTAMLAIFLGVGEVLAESGFATALVVKGRGRGVERRALGWNFLLALVVYGALALFAPGIARWYGEPILKPLLRVMALGLVINALGVVANARLVRNERFGNLALVNCASTFVGAVVAVTLAASGFGVWSIVALGLCGAALRTVGAALFARRGSAAEARETPFGEVLGLGLKYTLSNVIWVVYQNLWQLVIGKLWNPASVGLFTRGRRWAFLPTEIVNDSVGRVALPRLVKDPGAVFRFALVNCALLWPALALLYLFAEPIVGFVLGAQWLDCVDYLRILVFGAALTSVGNMAMKAIQASGRGEVNLYCDAVKRPLGILCLVVGARYGLSGLCWAAVASEAVVALTNLAFALSLRREPAFDVDFVFTYSGGLKPPTGAEACRTSDNGELEYAIRSVRKYAPWHRRIYVFVNNGTPKPAFITPDIAWVEHREVMDGDIPPLYNAMAIEMWLHRLPGLSEHFVYANDDMFLGRAVRKAHFFTPEGRLVNYYSGYGRLSTTDGGANTYLPALRFGRRVVGSTNDSLPHHNMMALSKSACEALARDFPVEWRASATAPRRVVDEFNPDAIAEYALLRGEAVRRVSDRGLVRLRLALGLCGYHSLYTELNDRATIDYIRKVRPRLFCLNDSEVCSDEDRRAVRGILEEIYGP